MNNTLQIATLCAVLAVTASAQVQPAATGSRIPIPSGQVNYSILYAQTAEFGGGLGDWQTSALSGSLQYANGNDRRPFTVNFGGGYNWVINGPNYGAGFFENLLLSQGIEWRKWNLSLSDDVGYTPEAPTFGFTGIPGIGSPITAPSSQPPTSPQSILTVNTYALNNLANADISHSLNYAFTVDFGGNHDTLYFPDGNGLNTNMSAANGGLQWRLDARNSLIGNYQFSQFTYPDDNFSFQSQSTLFGLERQWSRRLTTSISAGPDWTSSSNSKAVPSSAGLGANALLTYHFGLSNAGLSYIRMISGGAGYMIGSQTDTASADYSRQFGKNINLEFTASYDRTAGLQQGFGIITGKDGAIQASRRIGRYLNIFSNYSVMTQSSSASIPANVLNQTYQVVGFGFGFSPRPLHISR